MVDHDIDAVGRETAEIFGSAEGWTSDYITQALLDEYLEDAIDDDSGVTEGGTTGLYYYGNHPLWVRDLSQPGFVGRLYFSNGSPNRPNDPCGNRFRRRVWFHHSPVGNPYQNCGRFWGFQFINS